MRGLDIDDGIEKVLGVLCLGILLVMVFQLGFHYGYTSFVHDSIDTLEVTS